MNKLITIAILIVVLFIGITGVIMYFQYNNQYVRLKNSYDAQVSVDKAIYDEVWKVIKQQANISEKYSSEFKGIYKELMDARYKEGSGKLMQWITESNPNFDASLYKDLMKTIEAQRTKFTNNQKKMIAIHAEIKNLVMVFPGSLFLGSKEIPKLELITSTQTEQVFESGKDDNVDLFSK